MEYRKKILLAIAVLIFIIGGLFSAYVYAAIFGSNTAFEQEQISVYIPSEKTSGRLSKAIFPLLENSDSFLKVAKQKGYLRQVKGGKYELKKGMSNNDIINVLRSKPSTVKLSFNNQERLEDLAGRVSLEIEADSSSLVKVFKEISFLEKQGFTLDNALSMYLPNTYDFFWNTSAEGFRNRMLKEYNRFWNVERKALALNLGLTPLEVSSLAAIVHKESVKIGERPRVAGVYLNRLKANMKLQADPSVIYAMKKDQNDFNIQIKRVLLKDLALNSPFNTYKYKGIPPGPIFMPDISAIDAVLKPERHNYFYFVADTSNFGYHIFSKTLKEHNQNKRQYVKWINSRKIFR